MPLKNFPTVGILQGYEYLRGVITSIDHVTDTCGLAAGGVAYTGVPIYYHCKADKAERANGSIEGGSWAFADNDEVVVLRQRPGCPGDECKIFVIGFTDGARRCVPVIAVYTTQSGLDAIAWDLINDVVLEEFGADFDSISEALTAAGVTEQTLCEPSEIRDTCTDPGTYYAKGDDQPTVGGALLAIDFENEPFYEGYENVSRWTGTSVSPSGLISGLPGCSEYGVRYPYFENPFPVNGPEDAFVGPWVAYISGALYEKWYGSGGESINDFTPGKWDDSWGDVPYEWDQLYYVNPDTGHYLNRFPITITYLFFRSVFDWKFDYGSVSPFVTSLTIPALDLASTPMYISCRDAGFRLFSEISEVVWLSANMSQSSYDTMEDTDYSFMHPDLATGMVPMHPLFEMPYMIDKADGMATHDKTSLLFEFCGIYPDAYEFYESGQAWGDEQMLKYRQELRIFYRHPYPKKNIDAVLFKLVNDQREAMSRMKLEWNWNLYQAAQLFSDDIAARKNIEPAHIGSDGSTAADRIDASFYGHEYNLAPATVNGVPLDPPRTKGRAENVHGSTIGFKSPLQNVVDNTVMGESTLSHTVDGDFVTTTTIGWKQSSEHWATLINQESRDTGIATKKSANGKTYVTQTFGYLGDEAYMWPGFSTFNPEKLIAYVNENFTFDKDPDDTRRKPKLYLCTIPQD